MAEQQYYTVKVRSGEHQGQHRTYHAGEVFRTQYPLHEMFTNKFDLLPNAPAPIEEGPDTIRTVMNAQNAQMARVEEASAYDRDPNGGMAPSASGPVPPAAMSPYGEYAPHNAETFDFHGAKNVTNQFKGAKALGLAVWNSAEGYAVAEAGAQVPVNLAPSVLPGKKEVKEYLESMQTPDMPD